MIQKNNSDWISYVRPHLREMLMDFVYKFEDGKKLIRKRKSKSKAVYEVIHQKITCDDFRKYMKASFSINYPDFDSVIYDRHFEVDVDESGIGLYAKLALYKNGKQVFINAPPS